jgi:hypothetical protein
MGRFQTWPKTGRNRSVVLTLTLKAGHDRESELRGCGGGDFYDWYD